MPGPLFGRDGQSDWFRGARRAEAGRVLHEFPELGLRFKEFLDPLAQCGLSGTRLVKVGSPLGGRTVQGGREDRFFGSRIVFAHGNTFRFLLLYAEKRRRNNHRDLISA